MVYDITRYAGSGKHPGGRIIYKGAGKDASKLFGKGQFELFETFCELLGWIWVALLRF